MMTKTFKALALVAMMALPFAASAQDNNPQSCCKDKKECAGRKAAEVKAGVDQKAADAKACCKDKKACADRKAAEVKACCKENKPCCKENKPCCKSKTAGKGKSAKRVGKK